MNMKEIFKCSKCGQINTNYIGLMTFDGKLWSQIMGGHNICGVEGYIPITYSNCKKCGNDTFFRVLVLNDTDLKLI